MLDFTRAGDAVDAVDAGAHTGGRDKIVLERNNTSFQKQLTEHFKSLSTDRADEYSFLKYYQNIVRDYMLNVDFAQGQNAPGNVQTTCWAHAVPFNTARGLLVYHTMGMGKSILAVALAVDFLAEHKRQPIMLLTKSLQENMRASIHKYVRLRTAAQPDYALGTLSAADLDKWISANFSFVSMNASNMLSQFARAAKRQERAAKQRTRALEDADVDAFAANDVFTDRAAADVLAVGSLENKILIIDEAHNFFRAITNGSKNAQGLYDAIMRAQNIRLVFLTGTPINNDPFELVPCFNMLAGPACGSGRGSQPVDLLPTMYKDFRSLFVWPAGIKNKEKFQNRITGLVSYVTHTRAHARANNAQGSTNESATPADTPNATRARTVEFPEQLPAQVVLCNMTPQQYTLYQLARDKEREETTGKRRGPDPSALTKPRGNASTYRVRSRQIGNYAYFDAPDNGASIESPKYDAVYANIERHRGQLGLVYSQFVGRGGLGSFEEYLRARGWKRFEFATPAQYIEQLHARLEGATVPAPARYYAIITGAVSFEERAQIQAVFNNSANAHGETIALLLVSATGAEGLDLHNGRHVHVLEMYWNMARVLQIIYRFVRNDAHLDLDPSERNVQPYIYLAVPPKTEKIAHLLVPAGTDEPAPERATIAPEYEPTTDVELYDEAVASQRIVDTFLLTLQQTSIECALLTSVAGTADATAHCRMCKPTGQPLHTADVWKDIDAPDPCQPMQELVVQAHLITYAGRKYYYEPDPRALFDYNVYVYDDRLSAFVRLRESAPEFADIIAAIVGVADAAKTADATTNPLTSASMNASAVDEQPAAVEATA